MNEVGHGRKAGTGGSFLDRYSLTQQKACQLDPVHINVGG